MELLLKASIFIMIDIKKLEFLKNKGFYQGLKVYKYTVSIYDITYKFQERFLKGYDRTKDQMQQAARGGKQNLAEGSAAGKVSMQSEILLTNVAKASLQELLLDYEDYLRTRNLKQWDVNDERTIKTREVVKKKINNYNENVMKYFLEVGETRSDETLANIAITLIHMADRMFSGLQKRQQLDFLKEGGLKEQMYKARIAVRESQNSFSLGSPKSPRTPSSPSSPKN